MLTASLIELINYLINVLFFRSVSIFLAEQPRQYTEAQPSHILQVNCSQMEDTIQLTSQERTRLQNEKQIYCILRLMNFVQKFYSTDKIDQATYKTQINKLLDKYNKFSQITPNYQLQDFEKKYNIPHEDISWAKYVIEKGVEGQQSKETFLFMQATATFIEANQTLNLAADNPVIGDIRPALEKLYIILKKLYNKLGPDFTGKFNAYCRLMETTINNKAINQSLTESEYKQIKQNVEGMFKMMEAIMQN